MYCAAVWLDNGVSYISAGHCHATITIIQVASPPPSLDAQDSCLGHPALVAPLAGSTLHGYKLGLYFQLS